MRKCKRMCGIVISKCFKIDGIAGITFIVERFPKQYENIYITSNDIQKFIFRLRNGKDYTILQTK